MIYLPYLHFSFMILSVILVISAAILALKKKPGWFTRHRNIALLGVLSALLAFIAEFTFKTVMHYPHIKSPHAIAGVISLVLLIITPITGRMIAANPKRFRAIHKTLGRITSVAVAITAAMGIARFIQLSKK
jgi:uncharacterized membrane protein YozB (DUF420 family)